MRQGLPCNNESLPQPATFCMSLELPNYWRQPYHTSALSGQAWVEQLMQGHPDQIFHELGMCLHVFLSFSGNLQLHCGFKTSWSHCRGTSSNLSLCMCHWAICAAHWRNISAHQWNNIPVCLKLMYYHNTPLTHRWLLDTLPECPICSVIRPILQLLCPTPITYHTTFPLYCKEHQVLSLSSRMYRRPWMALPIVQPLQLIDMPPMVAKGDSPRTALLFADLILIFVLYKWVWGISCRCHHVYAC